MKSPGSRDVICDGDVGSVALNPLQIFTEARQLYVPGAGFAELSSTLPVRLTNVPVD